MSELFRNCRGMTHSLEWAAKLVQHLHQLQSLGWNVTAGPAPRTLARLWDDHGVLWDDHGAPRDDHGVVRIADLSLLTRISKGRQIWPSLVLVLELWNGGLAFLALADW